MHFVLIQPRSPWGAYPYLPNGLLMVAARCLKAGHTYELIDENLGDDLGDPGVRAELRRADMIGISVLGSPYIPEALRLARALRAKGYPQPIAIGGEVIMRLAPEQFARIYGGLGDTRRIGSDEDLNALLGVSSLLRIGPAPTMYNTSMGGVIDALPSRVREAYFGREWCLFTSQGCRFNCHFCAASKGRPEQFRDPDVLVHEASALARAVKEIVGSRAPYEVYCSTLDGCQTPGEMERTLRTVAEAFRSEGTSVPLRFLATAAFTASAARHDPDLLRRWRGYGLGCIGLGVDGDDESVWKRENKKHNRPSNIAEALRLIAEAGMQAEALMVIGFPGDDLGALSRAVRACFRLTKAGAKVRPYLGKAFAPGSKGWADGGPAVERFLDHPDLFRELDYGGLASSATHPGDRLQRLAANIAFLGTTLGLKLCAPAGCPTQPLMPTESVPSVLGMLGRFWNGRMSGDR